MNATRKKNNILSGSARREGPRAPDLDLSPGSVMATLIYRGEVFQYQFLLIQFQIISTYLQIQNDIMKVRILFSEVQKWRKRLD